jgi:hypothetical protein
MNWDMIAAGCFGGAIPDIIRLIQNRYETELPRYVGRANFWIGFIFLILLGGIAAWLGNANRVQEALAFGFAAPELVSRFLSAPNGGGGAKGGSGPRNPILTWWSF